MPCEPFSRRILNGSERERERERERARERQREIILHVCVVDVDMNVDNCVRHAAADAHYVHV